MFIAALKKTSGGYILNGNWALGYSNDYQGAGAVFKYHRPLPRDGDNPLEYIVAKGPTNESVDVMVSRLAGPRAHASTQTYTYAYALTTPPQHARTHTHTHTHTEL